MFHRIGPVKNNWLLPPTNISDFENQMKYLTKTHKILSLEELAKCLQAGTPLSKKVFKKWAKKLPSFHHMRLIY